MAQHIGIVKTNEKGVITQKFELNFAEVVNVLHEMDNFSTDYPWIATIDPYGSTVFNSAQISLVRKELEKILIEVPKLGEIVGKLISILEKIGMHQYIKFIGD
jgi:hypothetical protein